MKIDNAIILAAGTSSRFAPISFEQHKALIDIRDEILIERQIKQIREVGIQEIIVVVGYMAEKFMYLKDKYDVTLVYNPEYLTRNNNGSIYAVRNYLKNSYVCAADLYFLNNPFEDQAEESYYSVVYAAGETKEWCVFENTEGYINKVTKGGKDAWYMMDFAFWDECFSRKYLEILDSIYNNQETQQWLWEDILIHYLTELRMKVRRYPRNTIYEFDSLDELRKFDKTYIDNSRSQIIKDISRQFNIRESEIVNLVAFKNENALAEGFCFEIHGQKYEYHYENERIRVI